MPMSRLVVVAWGLLTLVMVSSPASGQDNPPQVQWEYAELYHHARIGGETGPNTVFMPAVDWISGDGFVRILGWEGMAEKLKAPALKPDAVAGANKVADGAVQRLRVLNHLGRQGWEMISHDQNEGNGNSRWIFKRRVGN